MKINATKSMIGHCLGAAGGMEAVATIQAIRTGWVHPTINHEKPIEVRGAGVRRALRWWAGAGCTHLPQGEARSAEGRACEVWVGWVGVG